MGTMKGTQRKCSKDLKDELVPFLLPRQRNLGEGHCRHMKGQGQNPWGFKLQETKKDVCNCDLESKCEAESIEEWEARSYRVLSIFRAWDSILRAMSTHKKMLGTAVRRLRLCF